MSSFLQRSKCDPVQVAVIGVLGVLLLFFVRLGSLGRVVFRFFQYFGQNHFELSECLVRFFMVLTGCCRENLV